MKVYYFDGYGRAEQLRMLLAHAKVDYEDVRLTGEDLAKYKAEGKFEFGQVPAVEIDGKTYAQSTSILRLLGKQHGYYSEDPITAWRIDSTLNAILDL